ncbi:MAG: hypothetical protein ACYC6N_29015 [Pirellulaceae bacterium]
MPRPSPSGFLGTVGRSALAYLHQVERERMFLDVEDLERYVVGNWQASVERNTAARTWETSLSRQRCHLHAAMSLEDLREPQA